MELWADVSYGSIYGRLRPLAADGLVETAGSERTGNLPVRTIFQITAAGRQQLHRALREALARPELTAQPVDVGLPFCATAASLLGTDELTNLLEERQQSLDALHAELREADAQPVSPEPGVRALVTDLIGHTQRNVAAEREWTSHVLDQLRRDAYRTPRQGVLDDSTPTEEID